MEINAETRFEINEVLSKCSKEQVEHMNQKILEVNKDDKPLGELSKLGAHLRLNDTNVPLHRAFSIFVFRQNKHDYELLLQKRSAEKITFPLCWTNTCCSHPSYQSMISAGETFDKVVAAIKHEAIERLNYELNIKQIEHDELNLLGRVHYSATSHTTHDGLFGENEIDYVFSVLTSKINQLSPNQNEVSDTRWVNIEQLSELLNDPQHRKSPWFERISKSCLNEWWPSNEHRKISQEGEEDTIIELDQQQSNSIA